MKIQFAVEALEVMKWRIMMLYNSLSYRDIKFVKFKHIMSVFNIHFVFLVKLLIDYLYDKLLKKLK